MLQACLSLLLNPGGGLTLTSLVTVLPKLACLIVRTDFVMTENIDYEGWNMAETERLPNYFGALIPDINLLRWCFDGGRSPHRLDTNVENYLKEHMFGGDQHHRVSVKYPGR